MLRLAVIVSTVALSVGVAVPVQAQGWHRSHHRQVCSYLPVLPPTCPDPRHFQPRVVTFTAA